MFAIALALSSSVCWGMADFVGGLQARWLPVLKVVLASQAIGLALVIVALVVRGSGPPGYVRLLPAIAGGLAAMAGLLAFYRGLAIGTMSIVAPIAATGVVVPVIVGIAGGDRPAGVQVVGIVAAMVGVVLASREAKPDAAARERSRTAIVLALVAALGFGGFFVGLRESAQADVLWALFASRGTAVAVLAGAVLVLAPAGRIGRANVMPLVAIGTLDVGANGLFALASRHGALSIVSVAGSLYPLATVGLARVLLGERVRRVQEVGIVTAVAGVVMIAAG